MAKTANSKETTKFRTLQIKNYSFKYLRKPEKHFNKNSDFSELKKIIKYRDIKEGLYEGGFKLWEGTIDLLEFLITSKFDFDGKTVLDLGCGHGLLGIWAMKNKAKLVYLQDFNENVLRIATKKNIELNKCSNKDFELVAGDWSNKKFLGKLKKNKFDVILTSETIYTPKNEKLVIKWIHKLLKRNGTAFVSAKRFYFGTGGSFLSFKALCSPSKLDAEDVKCRCDGKSNIRQILKITKTD
ncbi:hypothetical protein MHBO_001771 [Bonamia ostreae]|uniref:protein-histidine N-methyltransferase n=1 Tax=Bonamia ostreae TaxID=126728 RepID=A0ABV2AK48_9EUKA